LENKLKDKGKYLRITEESYTSKCDSLGMEEIGKHENYMGNRIKRGLYGSSKNKLINADLNGAINIMRKVINLKEIKGEGLFKPERIN
jgi:putative transposase